MRPVCGSERRLLPRQSSKRHRRPELFPPGGFHPCRQGPCADARAHRLFFLSSDYLVQDIGATVQTPDDGHPAASKGRAHAELSYYTLCSTSTTFITS